MLQPLKDISLVYASSQRMSVGWKRLQIHLGLFIVFFSFFFCFLSRTEQERKVCFHHFSSPKKNSGKFNTFCVFLLTAMAVGGRRVML